MLNKKIFSILALVAALAQGALLAGDTIVEFKGGCFVATNDRFADIFGRTAALFGPEVTFNLFDSEHWYGFASVFYVSKKGDSIGLHTPNKVQIVPMAVGLKYMSPCWYGDWYVGLGFQPTHVKTTNALTVVANTSTWGFGGVVKLGAFFDLTDCWVLDLFADYSFAWVGKDSSVLAPLVPLKANVSGCVVGAGLGYRF